MKQIVIVILLLLTSKLLFAQEIKKFDVEMGLSYSFAAQKYTGQDNGYKLGFQVEGRFNLTETPFSVGLHLGLTTTTRAFTSDEKYRSFAVLPVADYNFSRNKKMAPFVGLGIGIAFNNVGGVFNEGFKVNHCIMPRIGLRFLRHFSLSLDYQLTHKEYSHMNMRLGCYF